MRHRFIAMVRSMLSPGTGELRKNFPGLHRPTTRTLLSHRFSSYSLLLWLACFAAEFTLRAAEPPASGPAAETNETPHFNIQAYQVEGNTPLSAPTLASMFTNYTGTNIGLEKIVKAASDLQSELRNRGYPGASIAIAQQEITNGVVRMRVFQGAYSQILVSGKRHAVSGDGALVVWNSTGLPITNQVVRPPDTNVAHFVLTGFEILGNSLLSDDVLQTDLFKYTGTNATITNIVDAMKELQLEYRGRGYATVAVAWPQQPPLSATNAIVKLQVIEGTLAEILVTRNHFYSSNNVMAALPSLRTNMILNSILLQAELDRANANQDRQIYPILGDGAEPGTSQLRLEVKDRFPLHGKTELNNQSSPGTPELRLNSSVVYNNLWQENHSVGAQYSFSPSNYKQGNQWNFYDQPLVANYSAFYRMPLGNPQSISDAVESSPGSFGFNEATRKFNLPPPSGTAELNVFASRSTIDTGLQKAGLQRITQTATLTIDEQNVSEDLTVNQDLGFRLTQPLPEFDGIRSQLQGGLDFKTYQISSTATNNFIFTIAQFDSHGQPLPPKVFITPNPIPPSAMNLHYLPLTLRWDASRRDDYGSSSFGFSYNPNLWFSGTRGNFQNLAGSTNASGHWHILGASLERDQNLFKNWRLAVRADGQWSSEPLISNEQFGVGGVAGVRGYREGEVFGSTGWRVTSELKTPAHLVGFFGEGTTHALTVRASVFMDYAETYLLDPLPGQQARTPLWGTGLGAAATIGSTWEARLMFALPLLDAGTAEAGQIRISFGLNAQF